MEKLIFLDDAIEALQGREAIISSAYDAIAAIKTVPTIKTSEDCISRKGLIDSFLAYNKCKREEAKGCLCFLDFMLELIEDAPSVVPTVRKNRTTAEPQTYITEDRDTQILDAWQVHHRNITTVEGEPTTEQSSKVGKWEITDAYPHNVYCSECHKRFAQTHWDVWGDGSLPRNYCPNCGAKMKGADDVLEGDRSKQ